MRRMGISERPGLIGCSGPRSQQLAGQLQGGIRDCGTVDDMVEEEGCHEEFGRRRVERKN